jgi:hypothetical protein
VQGKCLVGGLELALRADVIIATQGAVLGHPEQSLGVITLLGGIQRASAAVTAAAHVAEERRRARAAVAAWPASPSRRRRVEVGCQRCAGRTGDHRRLESRPACPART